MANLSLLNKTQDYVTQEEVFSIFPAKGGIQSELRSLLCLSWRLALSDETFGIPLSALFVCENPSAISSKTCDPKTGEELFHAKNSSKFKVDFKVSFKNRARATKKEIYDAEISFRCDLVSSTMRRDGIVNKAQQASPAGVLN